MNSKLPLSLRAGVLCAVAAALGGCASNAPSDPAASSTPTPPPAPSTAPREPEAATLPVPGPASPAAQQQAQRMALAAVTTLEAGQEAQARTEVQRALALDPHNKLAQSLLRQMTEPVIAPRETFSYTVRPGDTLSSIAERYMGDKFLFYALARFNDIQVPRQLSSGQTLRVPGKGAPVLAEPREPRETRPPQRAQAQAPEPRRAPAPAPAPAPTPAPAVADKPEPVAVIAPAAPPPAPPAAPPGPSPAERAVLSAEAAERAGNLDQAVAETQRAAAGLEAGSPLAPRVAALNKRLAGRFTSNARAAFARQDLDGAIRHWDRVLQLNPGNDAARLERQRALALKEKMKELK